MTATAAPRRVYKYYELVMAAFVTVLLCANLIGASKVCRIGPVTFGAGVLFFPISYVFGDVLTEVYGYARARKVVWAGFGALLFASFMSWVVLVRISEAGRRLLSSMDSSIDVLPKRLLGHLGQRRVGLLIDLLERARTQASGNSLGGRKWDVKS